jgi:two-component system, LytTR family, sensor kinase
MRIQFTTLLIFRHVISWLIIITLFQIITNLYYELPIIILRAFFELLIFATPYYVLAVFILPNYHYHHKGKAVVSILILLIAFLSTYYLLEYGTTAIVQELPLQAPKLLWIMFSTAYYILVLLLANSFFNNQIAIQKLALTGIQEQLSTKHEILFFKNQFNDHVSFGFLNFCHKNFENVFENGANAIKIYKKMLEYTLSLGSSDAISLDLEIQYLEQFIHLQQLISKKVPVQIEKSGDFITHNILPRILITYLENAYKYGITNDLNKLININIILQEKELHFKILNYKKKNNSLTVSTGTGQINARQQLDLYYPNNYTILVEENELTYLVYLTIKLK